MDGNFRGFLFTNCLQKSDSFNSDFVVIQKLNSRIKNPLQKCCVAPERRPSFEELSTFQIFSHRCRKTWLIMVSLKLRVMWVFDPHGEISLQRNSKGQPYGIPSLLSGGTWITIFFFVKVVWCSRAQFLSRHHNNKLTAK